MRDAYQSINDVSHTHTKQQREILRIKKMDLVACIDIIIDIIIIVVGLLFMVGLLLDVGRLERQMKKLKKRVKNIEKDLLARDETERAAS